MGPIYVQEGDHEIDACLLRFRKPEVAVEVKWKETISREDIATAERSLEGIDCQRRVLFVPDKRGIGSRFEVMDVGDLAESGLPRPATTRAPGADGSLA